MDREYWLKQQPPNPLFKDLEWEKPQQKSHAGKLLIIGGNSTGFAGVVQAYNNAMACKVGECRAILPDVLKKSIGHLPLDCIFVGSNASGGIAKDAIAQIMAAIAWADAVLYIGDAGRNSETAIVYEQLLQKNNNKINVITRDSVDLVKNNWPHLLQNNQQIFVVSFAQLQKIFQSVFYPKALLFSMQLTNLVEALHKFTITYPSTIVVFHNGQILVGKDGQISTTAWENPMAIWRGSVAANAAVYAMWHPQKIFKAITNSLTQ